MVADGEFHVGITIEKSAIQYADDPNVDLYILLTGRVRFRTAWRL